MVGMQPWCRRNCIRQRGIQSEPALFEIGKPVSQRRGWRSFGDRVDESLNLTANVLDFDPLGIVTLL
jgi:hypothetical protein